MSRRQKRRAKSAPPPHGIEFGMEDFDRLTTIHLDLRDAELYLRLRYEAGAEAAWQAESLVDTAHARLGAALKLFEEAHSDWQRRLAPKRSRRGAARRRRPRR